MTRRTASGRGMRGLLVRKRWKSTQEFVQTLGSELKQHCAFPVPNQNEAKLKCFFASSIECSQPTASAFQWAAAPFPRSWGRFWTRISISIQAIRIRRMRLPQALAANPKAYDLESLLTHELGHFPGLPFRGIERDHVSLRACTRNFQRNAANNTEARCPAKR